MMKLIITQASTHLPLKAAKGSAKARIQKAQEMNAQLYEKMKGAFHYGEISPGILKTMIQQITGKKINIKTVPINSPKSKIALSATRKCSISGYEIYTSANPTTARIPQEYTGSILSKTFELFTRILNPKINTRTIKFINSYNPQNWNGVISQIHSPKSLNKAAISKILNSAETPEEKIDILQITRNQLRIQINGHKEGDKYQQKLNSTFKRYNSKYKDQVHYDRFELEEKLKLIEEILAETLKEERAKLAKQ